MLWYKLVLGSWEDNVNGIKYVISAEEPYDDVTVKTIEPSGEQRTQAPISADSLRQRILWGQSHYMDLSVHSAATITWFPLDAERHTNTWKRIHCREVVAAYLHAWGDKDGPDVMFTFENPCTNGVCAARSGKLLTKVYSRELAEKFRSHRRDTRPGFIIPESYFYQSDSSRSCVAKTHNQELPCTANSQQYLCVASPLTHVKHKSLQADHKDSSSFWESWCPCCKRPLDITAFEAHQCGQECLQPPEAPYVTTGHMDTCTSSIQPRQHYAYVAALWGKDPGFAKGAMVLGQSLKRSGTMHDIVLLHTDDVSNQSLLFLRKIWKLQRVEHVEANDGLFYGSRDGHRFNHVFTKLHALNLVKYDKVIVMDIDLVIVHCPDELFDLPAPAALWRGQNQTLDHGFAVDGRCFFGGADNRWPWSQTSGINAGVMLLAPDGELYATALDEVRANQHPERIPTSGPEQDYLSRFFAPHWTHISVLYNFQLHHMFYSLEYAICYATRVQLAKNRADVQTDKPVWTMSVPDEASTGIQHVSELASTRGSSQEPASPNSKPSNEPPNVWAPIRLTVNLDKVQIFHFSGELKFWDISSDETADEFCDRYLETNFPLYMRLWQQRKGTAAEYAEYGVLLMNKMFTSIASQHDGSRTSDVEDLVVMAMKQIRDATLRAIVQWRAGFESLPKNTADTFTSGDSVEVFWETEERWYAATVKDAASDKIGVLFDPDVGWPQVAYFCASLLRKRCTDL